MIALIDSELCSTAAPRDTSEISPQVPSSPVAFVFPGQGSQAVGMLKEVKDIPAVRDMLKTAKEILGYDLEKICLEVVGPFRSVYGIRA